MTDNTHLNANVNASGGTNVGLGQCDRCVAASTSCTVSTKLRRQTKARGFTTSEADALKRLEQENTELRMQLQVESQAKQRLQDQLDRNSYGPSRKKRRTGTHLASISSGSEVATAGGDAFVVKHMGRLVRDDFDTGRFAGSTTGVHFVLSVQDTCHANFPTMQPFPEMCYKSYLLQPSRDAWLLHQPVELKYVTVRHARNVFGITLEDVTRHLLLFETYWSGFCPSFLREQILSRARYLFIDSSGDFQLEAEDVAVLQTILLAILITDSSIMDVDTSDGAWLQGSRSMLQLVCQIHRLISTRVELWSLQALVMFSLYIQKSGKRQWMIPLNGVMVQMAQSLGLHRHARRFKFSAGEVEWRKRLWWSVYAFDKVTAVVHGLPQLIHDADVDNDYPVDCILQDTASTQLSHPLPGESTSVSIFCHYLKLSKILSRMLGQLYTTTDRRGGADKIKQLDLDLHFWASGLRDHPHVSRMDLGDSTHERNKARNSGEGSLIIPWLELLANITRLLIHLPGLTFDPTTTQFRDSLQRCVLSSATIVGLLHDDTLDQRITILPPCGPSVIFQCGLLQIYNQCLCLKDQQQLDNVQEQNRETLHQSVSLLEDLASTYDHGAFGEGVSPLSSLTGTLVQLQSALDNKQVPEHGLDTTDMDLSFATTPSLGAPPLHSQVDLWGMTAIESLNQFGEFEQLLDFIPGYD